MEINTTYHIVVAGSGYELAPNVISKLESSHCKLWYYWKPIPQNIRAEIRGAFIFGHFPVNGEFMDEFPGLKVISNHGVGYDHIDVKSAVDRNIKVGNTPSVLNNACADMTFALLLSVARNVVSGDCYYRTYTDKNSFSNPHARHGVDVFGKTIGIVGLGGIGFQVAKRALAFDMRILYHSRKRNTQLEEQLGSQHVHYTTLDKLLKEADFVCLHVPLTAKTRHLIGEDEFKKMKPSSYLINMARGSVIDSDALAKALQNEEIAGAALDVTEPEPLPHSHPLFECKNVVFTPHLGSATTETRAAMADLAMKNLLAGLQDNPLFCPVTL